jgi:hypothetical protein
MFENAGLPLTETRKKQMRDNHYYLMTLKADAWLQSQTKFSSLICRYQFVPPGTGLLVQDLIPSSQFHTLAKIEGDLSVGLNTDLSLTAQANTDQSLSNPAIPNAQASLGAGAKASGQLKGGLVIVMPKFSLELTCSDIVAVAQGSSEFRWRFMNPDFNKSPTIQMMTVFKAPKNLEQIQLKGIAYIEPNYGWLRDVLKNIIRMMNDQLYEKFKPLLGPDHHGRPFLSGNPDTHEKSWTLTLPQA